MNTLKINCISKKIKGASVLQSISLELSSGQICGLIGKNGSGKTMLIRAISGLMKPSEGYISWNDKVLYKDIDFIPNLGIIIENVGLYPEFTAFQNLKILSRIRNTVTNEDIANTLERVGLDPNDKRTVKKYSLGMKQKLSIAQAIMEKPEILILDEPTNALDDASTLKVREIVTEESKRGAIIIIASHNKDDIYGLCHNIYKMENGHIRQEDTN